MNTRVIFIIGFALLMLSLAWGCTKQGEPAKGQKSKLLTKEQSKKESGKEEKHNRMYDEPDNEIRNVSMILRHPGSIISVSLLGFALPFDGRIYPDGLG